MSAPWPDRFWAKVDRSAGSDGCWPWMSVRGTGGYGQISVGGRSNRRTLRAHRVALGLALGRPVETDLMVCHRCDNPICCNPAHLYEGTADENGRDRRDRGRAKVRAWKRPDALMRQLRLRHGDDAVVLDDADWRLFRDLDGLRAREEIARFVRQVEL